MKGQYAGDHIRKEGWHAQSGGGGEEKAGGVSVATRNPGSSNDKIYPRKNELSGMRGLDPQQWGTVVRSCGCLCKEIPYDRIGEGVGPRNAAHGESWGVSPSSQHTCPWPVEQCPTCLEHFQLGTPDGISGTVWIQMKLPIASWQQVRSYIPRIVLCRGVTHIL